MPGENTEWCKFFKSKRLILAVSMSVVTLFLEGIVGCLNTTYTNMIVQDWIKSDGKDGEQGQNSLWNSDTITMAMRVVFYGRLISPLTSYSTMKFGASKIIGFALAAVSVITFLTPLIIQLNSYLYVVIRIFQSLGEGIIYVSIPEFWAEWSPYQDRSKLIAIGLWGGYVAHLPLTHFCKYFIESNNRTLPFYVLGGLTLIVSILWIYFVCNNPIDDKGIDGMERTYIIQNKDRSLKPNDILSTWLNIVSSKPVWTLAFCKFAHAFGPTSIALFHPLNIKVDTYKNIDHITKAAENSYFMYLGFILIFGGVLDIRKERENPAVTPKINEFFIVPVFVTFGCFLAVFGFFHINIKYATAALMFGNLAHTLTIIFVQVHCINLAPQCAGLVAAFTEFWYAVGHICGSIFVGLFDTKHTPSRAHDYISILGIATVHCSIAYVFLGSDVPQRWSYRRGDEDILQDVNLRSPSHQLQCYTRDNERIFSSVELRPPLPPQRRPHRRENENRPERPDDINVTRF